MNTIFFAFPIVSWPGSWVGRRDFLADPSGKNFNCSQTKSEILALKNKRIQRAYISFLSCNETALVENLMVKKKIQFFIRALPLLRPISELYHSSAVCVPKQVQQCLRLVFAVRKAANRQTVITHDGWNTGSLQSSHYIKKKYTHKHTLCLGMDYAQLTLPLLTSLSSSLR